MHANPSTAHPCAHTEREQSLNSLNSKIDNATPDELFKINVLIEAVAYHELEPLAALIQASTDPKELELLTPVLDGLKAEIARARFQPIFTKEQIKTFESDVQLNAVYNFYGIKDKEQIKTFESDVQPQRDVHSRLALVTLSLTEKRLAHIAKHDPSTYSDFIELVQAAVEDSKAQLEMTESALNRLILVGLDFAGEVQA